MATLLTRLQDDMNASRKASDKPRTLLLGTVISEAKNRKIELQRELTDDELVDLIRKQIKRRRESIAMFEQAGRTDLVDTEKAQATMLEAYLPAQVDDDELRAAVRAAISGGAANIGAVMGKVMPQFKGRADGSAINRIAREELSAKG
jgi:uncharacterized protein